MEMIQVFCANQHSHHEDKRILGQRWFLGILVTVLIVISTWTGSIIGKNTITISQHDTKIKTIETHSERMESKIDKIQDNVTTLITLTKANK